jgi:hypothetical protein
MWCRPGPNASAVVQESLSGPAVLSVFLDPVNLVVMVPPFPDGAVRTARFLRQLAQTCGRWADELDPTDAPSQRPRSGSGGVHRLREADF